MNAEDTRPVGAARAARLTKNEAVFREVNERVQALNDFGAQAERFSIVCECGQDTCADVIQVLPEIEEVVEQHEGFVVVDKHDGIPEKIAAQTDPRA